MALLSGNSSNITNQNLHVLQLRPALVTYGDDGFTDLRFSELTFANLTITNPDFVFPLKGEGGFTLNKMDNFSTSNSILIANTTVQVDNKIFIEKILEQDNHGNFQAKDLGNPIKLNPKRTGNYDTFTIDKELQTGDYVLTLSKNINGGLIATYQTRLNIQ